LPGQYQGLQGQLSNQYGNLGGVAGNLGGLNDRLGSMYGALPNISGLTNPLMSALNGPGGVASTIANRGALSNQQSRDVAQQTRSIGEQQGNSRDLGTLGNELLNRDQYQQQRFNTAQQQALGLTAGVQGLRSSDIQNRLGITGEQGNLLGQQAGVYGQQAGVTGQQGSLLGQQSANTLGLTSGIQGLQAGNQQQLQNLISGIQGTQTGALNQALGTQGAGVSTFGSITNPVLGYLGNLFSNNLQGSIAQAQINQQGNQANQAKGSSGIGSILSVVGPILGAVASDERIKTKIKSTGLETKEGVPMKTFEYKTKPGVKHLGVMAQDVQRVAPESVIEDPVSGLKFIDGKRFPMFRLLAMRKAA
jgi:hypothetical protein